MEGLGIVTAAVKLIMFCCSKVEEYKQVDIRYEITKARLERLCTILLDLEIWYDRCVNHSLLADDKSELRDDHLVSLDSLTKNTRTIIEMGKELIKSFEIEGPGAVIKAKRVGRKALKVMGGIGTTKLGSFDEFNSLLGTMYTEIDVLLNEINSALGGQNFTIPRVERQEAFLWRMSPVATKAYGMSSTLPLLDYYHRHLMVIECTNEEIQGEDTTPCIFPVQPLDIILPDPGAEGRSDGDRPISKRWPRLEDLLIGIGMEARARNLSQIGPTAQLVYNIDVDSAP